MVTFFAACSRITRLPFLGWVLVVVGCTPSMVSRDPNDRHESVEPESKGISAQGRLLPASGIVQIGAIPGDRIEDILVQVGQSVTQGQVLARMRSEQLRAAELAAAQARLAETRKAADAKRTESLLNIDTARHRLKQAESQFKQAMEQKRLVELQLADSPTSQLVALQKQYEKLVALRQDPLTRPMIGSMELEARQIELSKVDTALRSSLLTAEQAGESASIAIDVARDGLAAAEKALTLVAESFPTLSMEKQIGLLELQLAQAPILAPRAGVILSMLAEAGETSGGLPIMELANLDTMICMAEVHEADIGQLAIGDRAIIRSSALGRSLQGRIRRIDSLVGLPQMRSPNPMARTDFRSVPILIELDEEDSRLAADRVQLQVDVLIQAVPRTD